MKNISFKKIAVYSVELEFDDEIVVSGYMNEKAWLKTVENNEVWLYSQNNGRVIEMENQSNWEFKIEETQVNNGTIIMTMYKKSETPAIAKNATKTNSSKVLENLEKLLHQRKKERPANSYTTHLFDKGEEKILKKTGEEAIEFILAKDNEGDLVNETADLLYHIMVYYVYKDIPFEKVLHELEQRMK